MTDIKTLVAFSGAVMDPNIPGSEYTEAKMNKGIQEKELNQTGFEKGAALEAFPSYKVHKKRENHALSPDWGSNKTSIIE